MRPYEMDPAYLSDHLDEAVQTTFDDLTSQFMLLPKNGDKFLEYPTFSRAYEGLRQKTNGFTAMDVNRCWAALKDNATTFVVIRTILGFTPPEWQDVAQVFAPDTPFSSGCTRGLDAKAKSNPRCFAGKITEITTARINALLGAACELIEDGVPASPPDMIHRLDKFDTRTGLDSVQYVAENHVPYAVVLYERYLGRPFSSHRDAVSEMVGDMMENAIEDILTAAHVPFRKTKRAERVPGFDQAPDFFTPDELNPSVIIEAKITGDDGTARDKVARVLRLAAMRDDRLRARKPSFEVVACIDGRGFGVRRQDMQDMIEALNGKVFTTSTLCDLVEHTDLSRFVINPSPDDE